MLLRTMEIEVEIRCFALTAIGLIIQYRLRGFPPKFGRGRCNGFSANSGLQRSMHSVSHGSGNNLPSQPSIPTLVNQPLLHTPRVPVPSRPTLSADQCHQLISFLQTQIQGQNISNDAVPSAASSTSSNDFGPPFSGMFSLTPFIASFSKSADTWILDTCATHHVYCSSSLFKDLVPLQNAFITLPNSHQVAIHSIGTIKLTPTLTLSYVLYVPSFSYNLLSISSLTSFGVCSVSFTHSSCSIQDASKGMPIGTGRRVKNLCVLDTSPSCNNIGSSVFVASSVSPNMWHSRLGHLGPDKLKLLSSILSLKHVTLKCCDICPLAKQKRYHFPFLKAFLLVFLI